MNEASHLTFDTFSKSLITVHKNTCVCTGMHTHNFLELAYVTEGTALHTMNGKENIISKGDYYIIDYKGCHGYTSIDNKPFEVINCLFKPEFIDNSLKYCNSFHMLLQNYLIKVDAERLSVNPSNSLFHDDDGAIYHYFSKMLNEYEKKQNGFMEMIRCTLVELIISTIRSIDRSFTDKKDEFSEIISYINENFSSQISLSAIAANYNFSLPYLSTKFKRETGMVFSEYIKKARIDEACRMLANTDKKILEISESVGYKDPDFFHRTFKSITGKTPGQFRKLFK